MDKFYKKMVTGMSIPLALSTLILIIMTANQRYIIRALHRSFTPRDTMYKLIFAGPLSASPKDKVIPYYSFFCLLMALLVMIVFIVVVSNKNLKANPGAGAVLLVLYGITPVLGAFYNLFGGDKMLYGQNVQGNISALSFITSMVISPLMVIYFAFFVIGTIRFIISAKKLKAQNTADQRIK